MIEDVKDGIKIAQTPEEALLTNALKNSENRVREVTLSLEIEKVVLEYLKTKANI